MIDSGGLLAGLQGEVTRLVDDLREQVEHGVQHGRPQAERLRSEYSQAFAAERTAAPWPTWRDERLTQVAVGWVLALVFVRFCEDNGLIEEPRLAGPGDRLRQARDLHQAYFRERPHDSDRDYVHDVLRRAAALPAMGALLGEGESPLWQVDPSADAVTGLLERFRAVDEEGDLRWSFTDTSLDTRFLGDLYQDLSEAARSTYALLQTPDFVERFILDRTLTPALATFGLANTSIIDPTCGSGHFLLGAFERLWAAWGQAEPATPAPVRAQRVLDAVAGVDVNPFAAAIARFRLTVAALAAAGVRRLRDAPDFRLNVAVGDSLLWGARREASGVQQLGEMEGTLAVEGGDFLYATEHASELRAIFNRTYSAVVGNPPYITVKDKALNAAYRKLYGSCSGKYSLGVPFTERFFELAHAPDGYGSPAGYVGMITANSFMKREFGKKLIEQYIPRWDLTHVVDTSGAYIPGHGTPTVILFGRHQAPIEPTIRTVMGVRGEPSTPIDPAKGLVWTAICEQIDRAGSESDFISVADTERSRFGSHPWSIGGGGAAELKEQLDASGAVLLGSKVDVIGRTTHTGNDEAFVRPRTSATRHGLRSVGFVEGEFVRDFRIDSEVVAVFPFDDAGVALAEVDPASVRLFWSCRASLRARLNFGQTNEERGLQWWEYSMFFPGRFRTPLSIAFAFKATHNHFVLDRGGKVFKQTAPVIKLPEGASEEEHLALVGWLNSSTAGFWVRQVCQSNGASADSKGARQSGEPFEDFYERDGTKLMQFPIPSATAPTQLARRLDELALELAAVSPGAIESPSREALDAAHTRWQAIRAEMVAVQEELDWYCLHAYGLTPEPLTVPEGEQVPPLALGERAFEIVLARKVAAGDAETAWFTRHGSTPITEPPAQWPEWYRALVARRIDAIESDRDVALVERPENKRRWATEGWEKAEEVALRRWLQDRLEAEHLWFEGGARGAGGRPVCRSVGQLASRMEQDAEWMDVARLWAGSPSATAAVVLPKLIADEHVPVQSACRYKPSGLAKRAQWEATWALQRQEDAGKAVGRIPVPPKYGSGDFAKTSYWQARGKLDVPKERFVSVPHLEGDTDDSLVLAWAGFDHAEQTQAIATLVANRQRHDGWQPDRLVPGLVGLAELLPWVRQWHPDPDPTTGQPPADFYEGFVRQRAEQAGLTIDDLRAWTPPATGRARRASRP